jgi:exopolysaccharide biosynthesis polyprenyl glycosylphosphotransferase
MSDVRDFLTSFAPGPEELHPSGVRPGFRRWVRGSWLVIAADILIAELVANAAYFFLSRYASSVAELRLLHAPVLFLAAASIAAANAWAGLYGSVGLGSVERFRRRVLGSLLMPWLALAVLAWEVQPSLAIVGLLLVIAAALIPLGLLVEAVLRQVCPAACSASALLVGDAAAADRFAAHLEARPELRLRPVGVVNGAPSASSKLPWLGRFADLNRLAAEVDVVAILPSANLPPFRASELPARRVVVLSDSDDQPTLSLVARDVGGATMLEMHNPQQAGLTQQLKRCLELCVAVPALLLSAPIIGLAALAIKSVSPGSAIYVQHRIGLRGERVPVHKLRSMYPDAEARLLDLLAQNPVARAEWDKHMKLRHDPRVLPYIGYFIRKTSIDELPQLWDVVRGAMALVGPRPFPDYHVAKFSSDFQALRSSVKPGLTGLWQVSDRSDADLRQQQMVDTFYIRNWSLWFDAYIVARTFVAVFLARGAR